MRQKGAAQAEREIVDSSSNHPPRIKIKSVAREYIRGLELWRKGGESRRQRVSVEKIN